MGFHDMAWPDLNRYIRYLPVCLFVSLVTGCTLTPADDVELDLEAAYGDVSQEVVSASGSPEIGFTDPVLAQLVTATLDGNPGLAAAQARLRAAAAEAVAIARTSPPDEANVLPDASNIDEALLVGPRVDGALSGWSIEAAVEHAAELNRRAAAHDPRLSVDRASVSSIAGSTLVLSSRGVRAYDEDAAATLSLMALATDGEETGGFDYRGAVLRRAADLDEESARIAREVADACVGNLGAKPGKSYVGPVLFAPAAFATAFVGPFASALSGLAVQRGRSGMADKLGEVVAPGVRVVDDPGDLEAAGACAFDREGQPTQRRSLVEDGVLTLIGALPSQALRQEALALPGAARGVREVVDSLAVPDPPATDTTATGTPSIDTTSVVPRDTLVLPKPEPEMSTPDPLPEAPAAAYHTVRRGDTLFRVAQRYGTTVAEIRRLNNLRSTTIAIGQRLRVR